MGPLQASCLSGLLVAIGRSDLFDFGCVLLPGLPDQLDRPTSLNASVVSCSTFKGLHFDPGLAIYR